uniref:GIY-YIG domain-containing protein n=1 Tax=Orbilia brochopaga TaxID=3140254 RepID=A0A4Y5MV15_9PEZI|nr:hypothetical protein [Drechslerella brochopaga]
MGKFLFKQTGWTLYKDKELLNGDLEAIKFFSMRENLVLSFFNLKQTLDYSNKHLFFIYVKMSRAIRQFAWVKYKKYFAHQRLNKEYLKNNINFYLNNKINLDFNYITKFTIGIFLIYLLKNQELFYFWYDFLGNCYINYLLIIPAISYFDPDKQKLNIYKDNNKKSGIYRWVNKSSGKSYIGSALNLSRRFTNYYSRSFLIKETKNSNSVIYKALLKHGYSGFQLEILEYCNLDILIEREQYYINLIKPEYNILKTAGSSVGFKHSKASIELIRAAALNRKPKIISEETKYKISESLLGRTLSEETKSKMKGRIFWSN